MGASPPQLNFKTQHPGKDHKNMTIQNTQFLKNIKEEYSVPNGMPLSVFNNKYSRVKFFEKNPEFDNNQPVSPVNQEQLPVYQNWAERITDVVDGNFSLYYNHKDSYEKEKDPEYHETLKLSKQGVMAYAGRHLQHGDKDQNKKKLVNYLQTALQHYFLGQHSFCC